MLRFVAQRLRREVRGFMNGAGYRILALERRLLRRRSCKCPFRSAENAQRKR